MLDDGMEIAQENKEVEALWNSCARNIMLKEVCEKKKRTNRNSWLDEECERVNRTE